jgi:hypothetical protein
MKSGWLLPRGTKARDLGDLVSDRCVRPAVGLPLAEIYGIGAWEVVGNSSGRVERHGYLQCSSRTETFHVTLQKALDAFGSQAGMSMEVSLRERDFAYRDHADARDHVLRHPKDFDFVIVIGPDLDEEHEDLCRFGVAFGKDLIVVDQSRRRNRKYPVNVRHVAVSDKLGGRLAADAALQMAPFLPSEVRGLAVSGKYKWRRVAAFARQVHAQLPGWRVRECNDAGTRPGEATQRIYDLLLEAHHVGDPYVVVFVDCDWRLHEALEAIEYLVETHDLVAPAMIGYDALEITGMMKGSEMIKASVVQDPARIGKATIEVLRQRLCGLDAPANIAVGAEVWWPGTPRPWLDYNHPPLTATEREVIYTQIQLAGERYERNPKDPTIGQVLDWLMNLRKH